MTDPNKTQEVYMLAVRKLMDDRSEVHAPLFDLPAKLDIGVLAAAHALPEVLRTLEERVAPEELGRRLGGQLGNQCSIGIQGLGFFYMVGRLQRYLYDGWPRSSGPDDHADAHYVLDFYERMMRSYRDDGKLSPCEEGARPGWPLLSPRQVAEVAGRARENGPPRDARALRRALAQIESFIWLLHADARDGIWHQGPYELDDGSVLVIKEDTDLRNPYMPWARGRGPSVSRVVTSMVLRGHERCEVDQFGTLHISPEDYLERCLVGIDVLLGDRLEPAPVERVVEIAEETRPLSRRLYAEMMRWDAGQKVIHGATQYASDMRSLFEHAGFGEEEIVEGVVRPFEAAAEPYREKMMRADLDPQALTFIATGSGTVPEVRVPAR